MKGEWMQNWMVPVKHLVEEAQGALYLAVVLVAEGQACLGHYLQVRLATLVQAAVLQSLAA
jgi:hypothetical protein